MERLTKKFTDGGAYCEEIIDVGIKDINYPTYVGRAVDKLAEYEELEGQGKLLKLPCAVGDTVYVVMPYAGYVKESVITGAEIEGNVIFMMYDEEAGYSENIFGKTVFLTKESAEKALKEMEAEK